MLEYSPRFVFTNHMTQSTPKPAKPSYPIHFDSIFKLEDRSSRWGNALWSVTFDLPGEKVNKLSRQVMDEFSKLLPVLEKLGAEKKIDVLVLLSGKPGNFIAGADIEMIQAARNSSEAEELSRMGQKLIDRWEDLVFPTVAAVNGAALGGGCEFSLASSAIVMSNDPSAKIGLPEVMLGLLPGMGGCVRMPRKVGLATAFDLILTGKTLSGERAFKAGLVEACLPKENFEQTVFEWVTRNIGPLKGGVRLAKVPKLGGTGGAVGALLERTPMGRAVILKKARSGVLGKTRGHYPAPLEAIAVVAETHGAYGERVRGKAREACMIREAQGFGKLAATDVSKNLIRLFFLTEAVKKSKGISEIESGGETQTRTIRSGAVLGAGVMGGGIAQLFAEKSIPVRMKDITSQALALGVTSASKIFAKQKQRKRINQRQYLQKMNYIAPVLDFSGFEGVDIVVEAVIEKLEIKQKVIQELEAHVAQDCVIASNTSSLSISKMQSVMKNPERFAGMHFFNPVSKMPLIEVIRGEKSSNQAVSTVFQFSKLLGKTPIVVKDSPGFLVNRLLMPYLNEATWLLADGADIEELDEALLNFGMPMGPMELIDEVGVDVGEKVAHILHDAFGDRVQPAPFNAKIVAAGHLGKKTNHGLYVYDEKGRNKRLDPEVYTLLGVTPQKGKLATEEMVERCILPMINEAARCLEEGVVESPDQVDLGMIMGTGFPPFRGGLLRYADTLGSKTLVERLKKYEDRFGARFAPAPALLRMASEARGFYTKKGSLT